MKVKKFTDHINSPHVKTEIVLVRICGWYNIYAPLIKTKGLMIAKL